MRSAEWKSKSFLSSDFWRFFSFTVRKKARVGSTNKTSFENNCWMLSSDQIIIKDEPETLASHRHVLRQTSLLSHQHHQFHNESKNPGHQCSTNVFVSFFFLLSRFLLSFISHCIKLDFRLLLLSFSLGRSITAPAWSLRSAVFTSPHQSWTWSRNWGKNVTIDREFVFVKSERVELEFACRSLEIQSEKIYSGIGVFGWKLKQEISRDWRLLFCATIADYSS